MLHKCTRVCVTWPVVLGYHSSPDHHKQNKRPPTNQARNIDAYDLKLVHRPRSETPDDAVSEVGTCMRVLW